MNITDLIVMNTVYRACDRDTANPHFGLIINQAEHILFVPLFFGLYVNEKQSIKK